MPAGDGEEVDRVYRQMFSIWSDTSWMKVTVQKQNPSGSATTLRYRTQMARLFRAPDDCELTPFDCVMLEQSIRSYGNEPPEWIKLACRYWLQRYGYTTMDMLPAVAE